MKSHPQIPFPTGGWTRSVVLIWVMTLGGGLGGAASARAAEWIETPFSVEPAVLLGLAEEAAAAGEVQVLLVDTAVSYDSQGRQTLRRRLVYRLLTPQGLRTWGVTSRRWSPWYQERPEIRARVITGDGRQHLLDPASLTSSSVVDPSTGAVDGRRRLHAPLPEVAVGAVVEAETLVRDHTPLFEGGTVSRHSLSMYLPVHRGRLVIEGPTSLPLRYIVHLMPDLVPKTERTGEARGRLVFDYRDVPAFEEIEDGLPVHAPRFPQVVVATGKSWSDVAGRYSSLVDESLGARDPKLILESLGPLPEAEGEVIGELLAKVRQSVRHTPLSLATQEATPRAPAHTLELARGDSKDQAALLVALLRAAGISAQVALVKTGVGRDVEPDLPGLGHFNHALVHVPGRPPLWIDPTHPFVRPGELPLVAQNRLVLVAAPGTQKLIRTPSSDSIDNRIVETREVFLADLGLGQVVETSEYHGTLEHELRAHFATRTPDQARQQLRQYVASAYLAEEVVGLDHDDPRDLSRPFTLRLEARKAGRVVTDLREGVVAILTHGLHERVPASFFHDGQSRQGEYVFAEPASVEWHYRIVPPPGFRVRALPDNERSTFGTAILSQDYRLAESGEVHAALSFATGHRRISRQEYEQLRQGLVELSQRKPVLIWFDQVGEVHLAAGRIVEAAREQERLMHQEPHKAVHRIRRARALLAGGMREAALREVRRGIELDPESSTAYWFLGWVLQHDAVGRRFGEGFDRQQALAALRRAKELEPSNHAACADLAILLEHDAQGVRYGPTSDLSAAIEEYRGLRDTREGAKWVDNLLAALFWARRFAELEKQAERALERSAGAAWEELHLTAVAVNMGPQAAADGARQRFPDPETRAVRLSAAAQRLLLVRRYGLAAELMQEVSRLTSSSTEVVQVASRLAGVRPHEELSLPPHEPATVVKRLLLSFVDAEPNPDDLRGLLHPFLVEALAAGDSSGDGLPKMVQEINAGLSVMSAPDLSREVVLDLVLGAMETTVEGDDEGGYRVQISATIAGHERGIRIFVLRPQGEYRIVATGGILAPMGREALRRVDSGDLDGARRWLDWARQEVEPQETADPLGGRLFLRFWSPDAPLPGSRGMRLAAAALMIDGGWAAPVLPLLEQAEAEGDRGGEAVELQLALAGAYFHLRDYAKLAEVARELLAREPASRSAYARLNYALAGLERFGEVRQIARQRVDRSLDTPEALRVLARIANRDADVDSALEVFERLRDLDQATSETYNEWAWLLLFHKPLDEEGVELAERAALLSGYRSYSALYTLAVYYAQLARPKDAYRIMIQALELKPDKAPSLRDWYVFGRIAEQYGLTDEAQGYYRRVLSQDPARGKGLTSQVLAERRLKELRKATEESG